MKKRIKLTALMLSALLLLTACAPNIEGTWKMTGFESDALGENELKAMRDMIDSGAMDRVFIFKGGRFTQKITYQESGFEPVTDEYGGKYRIDGGNQLVFISDGAEQTGITMEFKVEGNTMKLVSEEGTLILTKQN